MQKEEKAKENDNGKDSAKHDILDFGVDLLVGMIISFLAMIAVLFACSLF